jgi:DNA-directed RNA polymerase subunit RPC12/RpoP
VTEEEAKKPVNFPCKGCGSLYQFDPNAASLRCPHCGLQDDIPRTREQIREFSFEEYLRTPRPKGYGVEGSNVRCTRCGAAFFLPAPLISTECGYCGAPAAMGATDIAQTKVAPEAVLPFQLNEAEARDRYRRWVESLWFAPGPLRRRHALAKLTGVYRPYWTFDSFTSNYFQGERGDHYWTTEWYTTTVNGRSVRRSRSVRKTRWTFVSGQFTRFFDDVLVPAGKGSDFESVFRLGALKPFDVKFLSGWRAETYDVEPEQGWKRAQETMADALREDARRRIGGDTQRGVAVETAHSRIRFKHILLPLYVGSFEYHGKGYGFQVNGQTGEVRGRRPWSFWKIFLLVLAGLGILTVAILLIASQQNG